MDIRTTIDAQPLNAAILKYLKIDKAESQHLCAWKDVSMGFDGEVIFFENYAANLPEACKYQLGIHNILVNEANGIIFSALYGRFSIVVRSPEEEGDMPRRTRSITFDDMQDISELEEDWRFIAVEEEQEHLQQGYDWSLGYGHETD